MYKKLFLALVLVAVNAPLSNLDEALTARLRSSNDPIGLLVENFSSRLEELRALVELSEEANLENIRSAKYVADQIDLLTTDVHSAIALLGIEQSIEQSKVNANAKNVLEELIRLKERWVNKLHVLSAKYTQQTISSGSREPAAT